jgi:hypothetical protein
LDFVGETRRVSERIAALEKSSKEVESLWSDPGAVVLLCFFKIVLSTLEKLLMVVKDI